MAPSAANVYCTACGTFYSVEPHKCHRCGCFDFLSVPRPVGKVEVELHASPRVVERTGGFPFLAISKDYGLSYGDVIRIAERYCRSPLGIELMPSRPGLQPAIGAIIRAVQAEDARRVLVAAPSGMTDQELTELEAQWSKIGFKVGEIKITPVDQPKAEPFKIVADGPPCPTCGFRLTIKAREPFVYRDEAGDPPPIDNGADKSPFSGLDVRECLAAVGRAVDFGGSAIGDCRYPSCDCERKPIELPAFLPLRTALERERHVSPRSGRCYTLKSCKQCGCAFSTEDARDQKCLVCSGKVTVKGLAMMGLICFLFGHKPNERAGGQDGYYYWRCPRCREFMGSCPSSAETSGPKIDPVCVIVGGERRPIVPVLVEALLSPQEAGAPGDRQAEEGSMSREVIDGLSRV